MKKTRSLINGLLVCGVAFAMVSTLSAQTTKEPVAKVVRVRGAARCQPPGGGAWQELRVGAVVEPGSVLQSGLGGESFVDVRLTRQTVVHLYANTVLGVDKLVVAETGGVTVTETELDLRKGQILGNVKKLTAGSDFRIRYPKGVARIRGSIFNMSVEELKAAGDQVHVTFSMALGTGEITFTGPDGNSFTQMVQPLQTFDSTNPNLTTPLSPADAAAMLAAGGALVTEGAPVVAQLPNPGQTVIEYLQRPVAPTVTPTAGTVTADAVQR